MGNKNRRTWTDEQLTAAVQNAKSKADVMRALNIVPEGSNYKTIDRALSELGLDISHFTGRLWSLGLTFDRGLQPRIATNDMLQSGTHHKSVTIKNRLFADGLKIKMCEMCWLTEWLGAPIALELDHINGVNNDNRLENLRILCPNCHATTPTYRGRNQEKAKKLRAKPVSEHKPSREKKLHRCIDCGAVVSRGDNRTGCCDPCSRRKTEKIEWPCACKILAMISESNFLQTGKTLGVSDNAVRKRLKYHPTCECAPMIDS